MSIPALTNPEKYEKTVDDREKQIPAPKSWVTFEDLCHSLFKTIWRDPLAQKNARAGQPQHGVDIFGSPGGLYGSYQGVQCKGKEAQFGAQASLTEIEAEIRKAEKFAPTLDHWIFATTAPVDGPLQQEVRKISRTRRETGRFTVTVLGWGDIETLLCEHKSVLKTFYPELAFDIGTLLDRLQSMPHGLEVRELLETVKGLGTSGHLAPGIPVSPWRLIEFGAGRDLGPALLGRPLGPNDVAACPKLEEVDTVLAELKNAFYVRIVGEPGAGKSICAFQAAMQLAADGWSVLQLRDPRAHSISLVNPDSDRPTLFFIDDAHLTDPATLASAEAAAGSKRYLISAHNGIDREGPFRGCVVIDAKRAVRTIATSLRSNPAQTLAVVQRADDHVGELMTYSPIEERIDHAERTAKFPWQFCFILGGGWRRAKQAADKARAKRADIVLAAAAIHQLASRDSPPTLGKLTELLEVADISASQAHEALQWLVNERLLLDLTDLRCPHQRFAIVVLGQILATEEKTGRDRIGRILCHVINDISHPIAGLRLLLHEFSFCGSGQYSWTHLVPNDSLKPLIERCWKASGPEERMFAALLISELGMYNKEWPKILFSDSQRIQVIATWISNLSPPIGYGLARLLHAVRHNNNDALATKIVEAADPRTVAAAISLVTPTTAYHLSEFLSAARIRDTTQWGQNVLSIIEREALIGLAKTWPPSEGASGFAAFCKSLVWTDEDLLLNMVEAFVPIAHQLLSADPISAFRDLDDIAWHVLRVLDPLKVYVGQYGPKSRHRKIAAKMLGGIKPDRVAAQISSARLRDFQSVSFLLSFMARAARKKFEATAAAMDWTKISDTIGAHWRGLPHDAEVFIAVAYSATSARNAVLTMIENNMTRMEVMPARLALMAPSLAYKYVEQDGVIGLAHGDHVQWRFGVGVIAYFARDRSDLLERLLRPAEAPTSSVLSNVHPSWYKDAAEYIEILSEVAPQSMQRVLDGVDVSRAREGWSNALAADSGARRTIALLVEASSGRCDELGDLARDLRLRFPKASLAKRKKRERISEREA
ncbi:nSTAND3 domain-containing NTPase [Peristeroidobacter soli]|uniref:nSTAND3 domain-containing NTPase n=1 Tax=Peristeroidobacter soli TaxID=2497877 RepID=UPI00101DCC6B|nr:hypothetical protein [Peristeroidobacter soli]